MRPSWTVQNPHHWQRRWSAFIAAVFVFVLYLITVPRDLAGVGIDSAKFAYIPRILGVPHPPGYPLYMLVGWAFSHLPVGSLAFRMNLLSAVLGAGTVAMTALVAGELGCPPVVAALAGVLLGTTRLFWEQAIIAEVYTLHTFLIVTMFFALLRWARTGVAGWLYFAACCFGLGLAHHTDIALFVPAILLFLALTNLRVLWNPRIVLTACGLIVLCLCLYFYVVIRTNSGALYVEVPVTDVRGLMSLVRGDRFDYLLFRQPFLQSLRERGPMFLNIFIEQLGAPGLVLAAVGLGAMWRRSRAAAAFALAAALAVIAFALSYYAVDVDVFLLPAFVMSWILAAVAVAASPWRETSRFRLAAALILPWVIFRTNGNFAAAASQSTGFDARFARAFFQRLPERAAIIDNSFDVAHTLLYKILGEHATARKDVLLVTPVLPRTPSGVFTYVRGGNDAAVMHADADGIDRLVRSRSAVFVFGQVAGRLRAEGFALDPVQLPDQRLPEFLATLPRGQVVVAAVPRRLTSSVLAAREPMFGNIGGRMRSASPSACYAVIGVAGDAAGALEGVGDRLEASRGHRVGTRAGVVPADVTTRCGDTDASITVNGRDVARTEDAIAVAVLNPTGEAATITTATAATGLRVPFDWIPMSLYRMDAPRTCVPIGSTWSNVTPVAAEAGVTMHVRSGSIVRMYFWSDEPLRIRAAQANDGDISARVEEASSSERSVAEAAQGLAAAATSGRVTRVILHARLDDRTPIALALGGRPSASVARIEGAAATAACALPLGNYPILAGSYDGFERVLMDDARADLFGAGWHDFEDDANGGVRWTNGDSAHLLVPLSHIDDIRIFVDALAPSGGSSRRVSLTVNGRTQSLAAIEGWNRYVWTVPASHWRIGTNDLAIGGAGTSVGRAPNGAERLVGIGVREIDFQRQWPGPQDPASAVERVPQN